MKRKRWLVCLLVLTACRPREDNGSPEPVVEVKAVRVQVKDLRAVVRAPATVFGRQQAGLAARLTAPIRALHARKGERVAAGQVLAELDDRDLLAQRAEARAAVADAQAGLEKLTAGSLPTDVERARGELAAAEAALNQAEKIYERRRQLFEAGAIPARDLLVSQTEWAQARSRREVARKSLELLLSQSRERDIRMAQSRLEQSKARLAYIEAQLEFTRLRSPFAGVLTEQFMFPGDMAKPDAPIFTLTDLSVAVARAQVPESESRPVRQGQECFFSSADAPLPHRGRVSVVNQAVDSARRTVEVWCEVPNSGEALRAGVFGEVGIVTGVVRGAVVAPLAAVQLAEGASRGVVVQVDERRLARLREVETGLQAGGEIEIRRGLAGGELVVAEGGYGLAEGTRLKVREAGP